MTFQEAIAECLRKYADFAGRARRSEYWWFSLFSFLVTGALGSINDGLGGFAWFALFVPGLAAAVRRMHDVGRSGTALLVALIPILGWIIVLVWLTTDSIPADNAYGPPPPSLR